jgi:hypothetical protein
MDRSARSPSGVLGVGEAFKAWDTRNSTRPDTYTSTMLYHTRLGGTRGSRCGVGTSIGVR